MNTLERGLIYLGWQGGTIWQVEDALIKRLNKNCEEWSIITFNLKTTPFDRVEQMLDILEAK